MHPDSPLLLQILSLKDTFHPNNSFSLRPLRPLTLRSTRATFSHIRLTHKRITNNKLLTSPNLLPTPTPTPTPKIFSVNNTNN